MRVKFSLNAVQHKMLTLYVAKLFSDRNWTEIANKKILEFFSKPQEGTLVIIIVSYLA
jgi:hypothetical protein